MQHSLFKLFPADGDLGRFQYLSVINKPDELSYLWVFRNVLIFISFLMWTYNVKKYVLKAFFVKRSQIAPRKSYPYQRIRFLVPIAGISSPLPYENLKLCKAFAGIRSVSTGVTDTHWLRDQVWFSLWSSQCFEEQLLSQRWCRYFNTGFSLISLCVESQPVPPHLIWKVAGLCVQNSWSVCLGVSPVLQAGRGRSGKSKAQEQACPSTLLRTHHGQLYLESRVTAPWP